jgi:thiamine-phosphate pyrophosphorylase
MRALLGAGKIIGVSTHNLAQLEAANGEDIDYAAFGPLYETKTKSYSIGDSELKAALALSAKPLVCIGGINSATLPGVLEKGGRHIAVISAIASASDPAAAARQIKRRIYEADHQRQARGSV